MIKRVLMSCFASARDPFNAFEKSINVWKVDQLVDNGVLLLHGGGDISPSIYNQTPIKECHAGPDKSIRDKDELDMIEHCVKYNIPIIGICRGAQLLCAFDGGSLVQHIDGHNHGDHKVVELNSGEVYATTSCHHQMMVPRDKVNKIIAVDPLPTSGINKHGEEFEVPSVPEMVLFPEIRAIGVQGHPEWMRPNDKYVQFLMQNFVNHLM